MRLVQGQMGPELADPLNEAIAAGGGEAKRAFEVMMTMKKIDVAKIDAARRA